MENIKNNPQILAFINSQMQTGLSNQLNNEEQAKMIETLMKFQQFINNQNQNNLNSKLIYLNINFLLNILSIFSP